MVAAVPQNLADKYGHWTGRIPGDVLSALTVEQLAGRLQRAQGRLDTAMAPTGDGDIPAATAEAEEILAAPVSGAMPNGPQTSALKTVGITGADMDQHGSWISRVPDDLLLKMDRPAVLRRAELAVTEYGRTGSLAAADRILKADAHVVPSVPMTAAAQAAYRRGVREDLARDYGRWIADVPDEVLVKLDAAELVDRCEHVKGLTKRGAEDPMPGAIHGYLDRARQVLTALPRGEVEAEAARLNKAAMLSDDRRLAQGYMERVAQLREANPQPPAVARPAWLGKAVRGPEPRPAPSVLYKAAEPAKKATSAKKALPAKRQQSSAAKADSARIGLGLKALEAALLLLKQNPDLNKADDRTQRTVDELLEVVDQLL
ncbi:hypothetical protein OHT57_12690 [Streptomyces sp. NBC_00285]|uniref:hypothetical protein n=1 Tax=Streptomyces sp. NBC_00285 TaxID=2975700 RepID=UPI002E2C2D86|nr:hypothetical protein [Streptomyces sp. NBC_00285]